MQTIKRARDRSLWDNVRENPCFENYRNTVLEVWEENVEIASHEILKWSEYKLFCTTGDRKIFETKFFARRKAMNASALLAMIYPDEPKYIETLMDMIYAVCDEYTWCLPAHQWQFEHADSTVIDLFASETAFAFAEIYSCLGDRIDVIIRERMLAESERRVFVPYEAQSPYIPWEKWTNNWVAVCTGSIAGAYMLLEPERARALIPRFEAAMERFLGGYKDDGVCSEGCGYWSYGFGYFVMYADMIKDFTGGEIDHFANPKVKCISTFMQKMFISGDSSVNFSDGSRTARYNIGIQHYLKKTYPDDILVYKSEFSNINLNDARISMALRSAVWYVEEYAENPDPLGSEIEFFAKDTEWFIKKCEEYGFAAKAGNNNEFHNHNDVGSFIFAKNGKHILTDTGSGVYTKQYFNHLRYTIFEATSAAHSVPIIGGAGQINGDEYRAKNTKFENGVFSFDMSGAYGINSLKSLERSFSFENGGVVMRDSIDYVGDGCVCERLVALSEPRVSDDGLLIFDDAVLSYDKSLTPKITKEHARFADVYLIDFELPNGASEFEIFIK